MTDPTQGEHIAIGRIDKDVKDIKFRNRKLLKTGNHDFKIDVFHVNPVVQITQLNDIGLKVESAYSLMAG